MERVDDIRQPWKRSSLEKKACHRQSRARGEAMAPPYWRQKRIQGRSIADIGHQAQCNSQVKERGKDRSVLIIHSGGSRGGSICSGVCIALKALSRAKVFAHCGMSWHVPSPKSNTAHIQYTHPNQPPCLLLGQEKSQNQ